MSADELRATTAAWRMDDGIASSPLSDEACDEPLAMGE